MNLTHHVDRLRTELAVAAEAGGDEARALAERLTAPLESATRLMLLEVLSAAADEITRDLAPGSVELRLRGGEPEFVVTPPPGDDTFADAFEGGSRRNPSEPAVGPPSVTGGRRSNAAATESDDSGTARLNLRLVETVKQRMEEAARQEGLSLNAWLVRVAAQALDSDLRSRQPQSRNPTGGQSYTGWVR
jgi:hypothetical protein